MKKVNTVNITRAFYLRPAHSDQCFNVFLLHILMAQNLNTNTTCHKSPYYKGLVCEDLTVARCLSDSMSTSDSANLPATYNLQQGTLLADRYCASAPGHQNG